MTLHKVGGNKKKMKNVKAFGFLLIGAGILIGIACILWYFSTQTYSGTAGDDNASSEETLGTLPYVTWTPVKPEDAEKSGVTQYKPKLAYNGVNIYQSENRGGGYLMDMSGNVLHRFENKIRKKSLRKPWKLIEPYTKDDFLVLIEDRALLRIDWDSNVKWLKKGHYHHDIAVAPNGDIYTLVNEKRKLPLYSPDEPVRDNFLVILNKNGKIKKKLSFAEVILSEQVLFDTARNQQEKRYAYGPDAWDIFHSNTLEIINKNLRYPPSNSSRTDSNENQTIFDTGTVLFCVRHIDTIGVLDVEKEKIIWHWGLGELDFPHHPSTL